VARVAISKSKVSPPVCIVTGSTEGVENHRVEFVFRRRLLFWRRLLGSGYSDLSESVLSPALAIFTSPHPNRVDSTELSLPFSREGYARWRRVRTIRRALHIFARLLFVAAVGVIASVRPWQLEPLIPLGMFLAGALFLFGLLVIRDSVGPRLVEFRDREVELEIRSEVAGAIINAHAREQREAMHERLAEKGRRRKSVTA
jgi:hypothetical protein